VTATAPTPNAARRQAGTLVVDTVFAGYGPIDVLRGISLNVDAEEVVTVLGANGAGKTTLLRTIAGIITPREGRILMDGDSIGGRRAHALARRGLGHVPSGRELFPELSVEDNLTLGGTSVPRARRGELQRRVLELFPALQELVGRPAGRLSGGEQQMVAIGRALVAKPRLLLLDEPSLGLSPKYTQSVYAALAQVRDRIPMLLVEQNTVMALKHCSRAAVMVGGKLVLEGTAEELADREALVASYLGEEPALSGEEHALHSETSGERNLAG
jgi:branched-chain amino acid transport system ATP-binding protein